GTALVLVSAGLAAAVAWGVRRGLLTPGRAAVALTVLLVADLVRGGLGVGRQVHPSFLERLPEVAALPLLDAEGGRLFSLGPDHSPSFRAFLARGGEDLALTDTFVRRQVLSPATNVLDRLESPDGGPGLASRDSDLDPALRRPGEIARLLPWLRNAGVSRLLSLDRLADAGLVPLGAAAPGPPGLAIHAYAVDAPWPRVAVACRVVAEPDRGRALRAPREPGFDPRLDVVLAPEAAPAGCRRGRARLTDGVPTEERYDVEADGVGYLVVRASAAPGWRALVDGEEETVRLANGKHRAVRVGPGRHEVVMRYDPPGLRLGLAATGLALLAAAVLWIVAAPPRRGPRR
ncbi:MAG TPA: YfhO family protein, partial [Vicinamibacteria bacterium]